MLVTLHVEHWWNEKDEYAYALAIADELVPKLAGLVWRGGLVGVSNEGELLHRRQVLQVCEFYIEKLRGDAACNLSEHRSGIRDEFIVAQLVLPIFPLVIILLQHVLFCPLWSLMGDTLLSDTLSMIAKLVLFVGLYNFLEL